MYTSIRHYNVTPDSTDDVIKRAVEGFLPIIAKLPGFATYDVVNTGHDTVTTISTFENQGGIEQSNEVAATWIRDNNLTALFAGPPIVMGGLVGGHMSAR